MKNKKNFLTSHISYNMFLNTYLYQDFISFWYKDEIDKDIRTYKLKPIYLNNSKDIPFFIFKKHFHKIDIKKSKNCLTNINHSCKFCNNNDYWTQIVAILPTYIITSPNKQEIGQIKLIEIPFEHEELKHINKFFDENFCLNIQTSKNNNKLKFLIRQEYYELDEKIKNNLFLINYNYNDIFNNLFNNKRYGIKDIQENTTNFDKNMANKEEKKTKLEKNTKINNKNLLKSKISLKDISFDNGDSDDWEI